MRRHPWISRGLAIGVLGMLGIIDILGGCSEEAESTCAMAVSIAGDLEAELTQDSSVACGILHSFESGIEVVYIPTGDGGLQSVDLVIDEVMKGETGAGFPAALRIRHSDGRGWNAVDCTVTVETHEYREPAELGESYRVVGHGECPSPATSDDGSVTVEPFEFIVHAVWRD